MKTEILLNTQFLESVLSGKKTATIRKGLRNYNLGPATIISGETRVPIFIWGLRGRALSELGPIEARDCGYSTVQEMLSTLAEIYPGMEIEEMMTVVDFQVEEVPKP